MKNQTAEKKPTITLTEAKEIMAKEGLTPGQLAGLYDVSFVGENVDALFENEEIKVQDDKKVLDKRNKELSAAIALSVELDGAFKLFSYRVIAPEQFVSKAKELVEFYNSMKQ